MTQSNSFIQNHGSPQYSRQAQEPVERQVRAVPQSAVAQQASEPKRVLVAEQNLAKSLRERIGRENMTQSSTVATRRLDEALLRLDRAAGRRGAAGFNSISTPNSQSKTSPRSRVDESRPFGSIQDVELDESIAESSALWLETDDHSLRMRVDTPVADANLGISAPHRRSTQNETQAHAAGEASIARPPSVEPELDSQPDSQVQPDHGADTQVLDRDASWQLDSVSALNELFTTPIDAMLVTEIAPAPPEVTVATESAAPDQAAAETKEASSLPEPEATEIAQTEAAESKADEGMVSEKAPPVPEPKPKITTPKKEFLASWQVDEFEVPDVVEDLFLAGTVAEPLAQRMHAAHRQGLQTLAVTSAHEGEGRSTVAMGLALSIAFSGLKVALVDADLSAIPLAIDLNLELDNDWRDAVRGKTTLEEIAVASDADSVTLIPLLTRESEPAPYVAELSSLLSDLNQSFDLVIVDCPAASTEMAGLCDTAIIVRDMQRTKAPELETYSMSLRRAGLSGVGVVENFG